MMRWWAMLILTGLLVSLSGCSTDRRPNDDLTAEDFRQEKEELKKDLVALRNDIDRELGRLRAKLERSSKDKDVSDDQVELEKANRDLTRERSRVDNSLEDIENASEESWNEVKVAARKTSQEVKEAFTRLGNKLEAWFEEDEIQD